MLEYSDILLPIIEQLDENSGIEGLFGLPAVVGVFCFLPGLVIGVIFPKPISIGLIGLILVTATIAIFLISRTDKVYRKKYIRFAAERGVSSGDAEKNFDFWKGLNSRARKRLMKDLKRRKNAKN